jgi:hypothetical protein
MKFGLEVIRVDWSAVWCSSVTHWAMSCVRIISKGVVVLCMQVNGPRHQVKTA